MSEVIERKLPGEPGYTIITTLQNNGAWGQHDLSYDDNIVSAEMGAIKYRIKMIIATDTTFYLDSMSVNNNQVCNTVVLENKITIAPNPVSTILKVEISRATDAKINIVIQNALGQKVYSNNFMQVVGTQTQEIHMERMSGGAYFVTVYIDNKKEVTKKIIKK